MAAITQVSNILNGIKLDKKWTPIELGTNIHTGYLIAIKEEAGVDDTIDVNKVVSILFEIAIESGIEGKYITIQRPNLNFNDFTSSDDAINKSTAFTRVLNLPTKFYIRPLAVNTVDKQLVEGEVSIDININPVNLGCN